MSKTSKEKEAVLDVFARLIKPLMRAAFEYGISAGEISGVVRRTYIQALEARLSDQKRPTTDARIAAIAGLARTDVTSLRDALRTGAPHSLRETVSPERIGNVLTTWHTHANFSGAYGLAMDLDLVPITNSPRHSFKELVEIACPGADEDALLDALVAAKSVEVVDGVTVRCLSRAYVTPSSDVTRIEQIGQFMEVVTSNFVYNLLRAENEPKYFERAVVSDGLLSEAGRDEFMKISGQKGQELLSELDTILTQLDSSKTEANGKRYGLGIYFFEDQSVNRPESRNQELRTYKTGENKVPTAPAEIDVLAALPKRKS
ncbi:MAG: hypothetical protein JSR66_07205 [Proteobacteria bacterium]|nr:hypothetical protein [Pseudomonadota bacterium]